ncbi:MAG TPA: HAMP domain-containing sensor histidine kinase [Pirellulaceae bacterium]|jgi:signal transduction histidine kinase|nr:HAMP domain-containing sensor histidine kinase [Pirellulaceae bacterium]
MRYPWRFWILYAIGVLAVGTALAALTHFTLKIEQAEALAQKRAELEDRVSQALWRIDSEILAPIVAEQATLPGLFYEPIKPLPQSKSGKGTIATFPRDYFVSPLLTEPSEFTLLHFQIDPWGRVVSPQIPEQDLALVDLSANPALEDAQAKMPVYEQRFQELKPNLDHDFLVACLPAENLPSTANSVNASWTLFNGDFYGNNAYSQQTAGKDVEQTAEQQAEVGLPPEAAFSQQAQSQAGSYIQSPYGVQQQQDSPGQALNQQQAAPPQQAAYPNAPPEALERLTSRNTRANYQAQIRQQAQENFLQSNDLSELVETEFSAKGVSQALWVDGKLLLARRATKGDEIRIQGSWLDWNKLRERILEGIRDVAPEADVAPATEINASDASRLSATLPLQLIVPTPTATLDWFAPARLSALAAWSCYLVVAALAAYFLHGVIQLAERRASFVSAVTHELRTPLTTLRMYAEMLSEDMVPEGERRRQYVRTLRLEAERLSHLVENVLAYARLERGRPSASLQLVALDELLAQCERPLAERASQAEMQWSMQIDPLAAAAICRTDPGVVEQILLNLVDNCCKYGRTDTAKRIALNATAAGKRVEITVSDDGPGVPPQQRTKLFRPFSKTDREAARSAPGVGLGLALSRRMARQLGGELAYKPLPGGGARFVLSLPVDA